MQHGQYHNHASTPGNSNGRIRLLTYLSLLTAPQCNLKNHNHQGGAVADVIRNDRPVHPRDI